MARWRLHGLLAGVLVALPGLALPGAAPTGTTQASSVGAARAGWQWPLEPTPAVVRRFQPSPTPWGAGHRGVDLLARAGQPVLAAGPGVVSFSGVLAGRGVLAVTHVGGLRTTYEPVRARAPAGTVLRAGQQVAVVDVTPGHCSPAVCLHWGLLRGAGPAATYLDPLSLLGVDLDPPVLLPLAAP
jgi:murein DD-endopeptidase MepM/ murein hydrolase activator NlpD